MVAAMAKIEAADASTRDRADEQSKEELESIYAQGKTPFMVWYEKKMEAAASGDVDALRIVEEKRAQYEAHLNNLQNKKQ